MNKEAKLVNYFLKKKKIVLPEIFLKQDIILELEKALSKGKPVLVSEFFKKIKENFEDYIDIEGINKIVILIKNISELENFQQPLSEEDEKIINFLVEKTKLKDIELLEIIGQYYFIIQVVEELEKKRDELSKIIKIPLFMWSFVNIYELLLHEVDRRLLSYLKKEEKTNFKKFMNNKREEYKDHASAGLINEVFSKILNFGKKNNSIFSSSSGPKLIRNKISHSNIFYDSEKDKIVFLNGQEFTIKEFLKEYYQLFNFLFSWLKKGFDNNFNKDKVISNMKKTFNCLVSDFLKIERAGLKKEFSAFVFELKKEVELINK